LTNIYHHRENINYVALF